MISTTTTLQEIQETIDQASLSRDDFAKLHRWIDYRLNQAEQAGKSIWNLLELYCAKNELDTESDTVKLFYRLAIRNFYEAVGRAAGINDLNTERIAQFARWLQRQPISPQTKNARLRAIRALVRFAVDEELVKAADCREVLQRDFARLQGLGQERKEVGRQAR
jgi:hypothetical protein